MTEPEPWEVDTDLLTGDDERAWSKWIHEQDETGAWAPQENET